MALPMTEQAMDQDERLVDAVRSGGSEAFRRIVERYQSAVFAVAMSRVRDFHRAEDVAQQTFLEAYQRLGSLKEPGKLGGWLRTITVRQSVDALRRKRDEVQIQTDGLDGLLIGDAEKDIERRETERRVRAAIGRLKQAHRDTTTLFYVEGYSVAEVAAILEVPVGTVKRRLHTAREILKTEMIDLVKDALTSEKPGDDFGDQVFTLIRKCATGEIPRRECSSQTVPLMVEGFEGLAKALESPHGRTRRISVSLIRQTLPTLKDETSRDKLIEVLKNCLQDPNRRVRRAAMGALFRCDVPEERKRREFVPLAIELLTDRAEIVAKATAMMLGTRFAADVSLEAAALALVSATDKTRPSLSYLVSKVVDANGA